MSEYVLKHTGDQLDEAIEKVLNNYIDPKGNSPEITENGIHYVREYENAVVNVPIPDGYIKPNGTKIITDNGLYNIAEFENVDVNVNTVPLLQEKTITPTKSSQTVTADEDYTGLSTVHVEPIPDEYIKPDGSMDITENGTFDVTEKAEVKVNVQAAAKPEKPYIDSSKLKYFAYMFSSTYGTTDLSLLENLDTSDGIDFSYMFSNRTDLTEFPIIDTSNGINFLSMFSGCTGLTGEIGLDTSNGTNFNYMFSGCTKLQKITRLDTSKATNINGLFANTVALESVPLIDTTNCTNLGGAFNQNWGNLTEITLTDTSKCKNWNSTFGKASKLVTIKSTLTINDGTYLTGMFYGCYALKNVTFDYIDIRNNSFSVQYSPLSEESLASLVNALSDNSGLDTTYTVTLGAANIAKLTDEQLSIVAAKNINLA